MNKPENKILQTPFEGQCKCTFFAHTQPRHGGNQQVTQNVTCQAQARRFEFVAQNLCATLLATYSGLTIERSFEKTSFCTCVAAQLGRAMKYLYKGGESKQKVATVGLCVDFAKVSKCHIKAKLSSA